MWWRRKRTDEKDVKSRNAKLGQSRQKEGQVRCVCVFEREMSLHKQAQCWMLIRDNKTSIKDLFWRDRSREGQMIERGRRKVESRDEWEREHSGLCHRVDYTKDTSLHPSLRDTHVHTYTHIGAQTLCILIALSPPAIIPDNSFLNRHSSSEVSFVLPDRLKQELTG